MFLTSVEIFKENIFFGTGIKTFREECKKKKYNLIINSELNNPITKKFFQKKIEKNYGSFAHTAIINNAKIYS